MQDRLVMCVLLMFFTKPSISAASCTSKPTYCEVGQTCRLYPPVHVSDLQHAFFKRNHSNTIITVRYQNDSFTFIPSENIVGHTVFKFNNNVPNDSCYSTVFVFVKPAKVENISCSVNRHQFVLNCTITAPAITDNEVNVTISSLEDERSCNVSKQIFLCPFNRTELLTTHTISITTYNKKVVNTRHRISEFNKYITSYITPLPLQNVTVSSSSCFAMQITASASDDFLPLDDSSLILYNIQLSNSNNGFSTNKQYNITDRELDHVIHNISAFTYYNISVRWSLQENQEQYWSSWESVYQKTKACAPSEAPTVFTGGYSLKPSTNQLVLYWKKIAALHENGPNLEYTIYKLPHSKAIEWQQLENQFSSLKTLNASFPLTLVQVFNRSSVSGILTDFQDEDVVLIAARNSLETSDKYAAVQLLIKENVVERRPLWQQVDQVNDTHNRLLWNLTDVTTIDKLHIYWCYGIWRQLEGWVECKDSIKNITILPASSYDIVIPTGEQVSCDNCSWHYGISAEYPDVVVPIVWNCMPKLAKGLWASVDFYFVYILVILVGIAFIVCIAYIIKRCIRCAPYRIVLPPLEHEIRTLDESYPGAISSMQNSLFNGNTVFHMGPPHSGTSLYSNESSPGVENSSSSSETSISTETSSSDTGHVLIWIDTRDNKGGINYHPIGHKD